MKQLEVLDWAMAAVVSRLREPLATDDKQELERKLKELARLYVLEAQKDK